MREGVPEYEIQISSLENIKTNEVLSKLPRSKKNNIKMIITNLFKKSIIFQKCICT